MDLHSQFKDLVADLDRFRTELTEAIKTADDPEFVNLMSDLSKDWDQHYADLKQAFPDAVRELEEQQASIEQTLDEARKTAEEAQQKLAEAATRPAAPEPEPSPGLSAPDGVKLREELLDLFGIARAAAAVAGVADEGDVGDMSSRAWQTAPEPTASAPPHHADKPHQEPAPGKTTKPKPKESDDTSGDAWRLASGDFKTDE